jgi:hypothetical protein
VTPTVTPTRARKAPIVAARFEDEQQPYLPLVLSMWKNRYGTYDHLSRVKEWSVGGTDEEDGMGAANERASHHPEAVLRLQITASDPAVSAWVAANAGSGKTHVLAQRVIRLLLDGVEPGRFSASRSPRPPPQIWPTACSTSCGAGPRSTTRSSMRRSG